MRAIPEPAPLVGRDRELSALDAAFERAADGRAAVILCVGEAGIGKTRLVTEFRATVEARSALTLRGGAVDAGDDGLPYGVVVEALRHGVEHGILRLAALPPAMRGELAVLLPGLDGRNEGATPPIRDAFARVRLFEAMLALLVEAASRAPLVIVLEDLHWADRSTLDVISFLAHNLAERRVVLLTTFRPAVGPRTDTLRAWLAEFARRANVDRIELAQLGRGDAATLIAALAPEPPSSRLVESVIERSNGIPYAIEELTAQALEAESPGAIPGALRDSILSSLATLGPAAQAAAGAAAVLGESIDEPLLAAMLGCTERELSASLRELVGRRILVPAADEAGYAFRHELTREVAYTDLLAAERRALHAAAATALEDRRLAGDLDRFGDAAVTARIAGHRAAGGSPGSAFASLIDAADAAWSILAFAECAAFLSRALDLWEVVPPDVSGATDRAELGARAAEAHAMAGDPERASELAEAALGWLGRDDRVRRGLLWERLADYRFYSGAPGRLEAAREAVRLLPTDAPAGARIRAHVAVVEQLAVTGDVAAARREAERTVRLAREGGWHAHETIAIANRPLLAGTGTIDEAVRACREGVRLGLEARLPDVVGISYVNLLFCLNLLARFPEAVTVGNEALEVARRLGLGALIRLQIAANGADALALLGRWDESDRLIRSVAGEPSAIVDWLNRLALAATAIQRGVLDHAEELERVVEAGAAMAGQISDWAHALAAELALLRGNVAAVRRHADAVLASSGPASWRSLAESQALGAGLAAEGRAVALARLEGDVAGLRLAKRRAATFMAVVERLRAELPDDFRLPRLFLATAVAEATRLDGVGDAAAWRSAADGWAAVSVPYWEVRCRLGEAEALADRALDQPRVTELLRAAHATATSLGARRLVADAEAAAARARVSLEALSEPGGEPDVAPTLGLSSREREVLSLVAEGLTNREIGERLVISPKTAGVHVSNILAKLGARGRLEAAAIARRAGIV